MKQRAAASRHSVAPLRMVDTPTGRRIPVVLYVEDDPDSRALMTKLTSRVDEFVALMTATTGHDALALLEGCAPDLVLLDLDLPDMNGREILESIRSSTRTAEVPVVVISGHSDPAVIDEMIALGATDYITKPFDVAVVMELLASIADQAHDGRR